MLYALKWYIIRSMHRITALMKRPETVSNLQMAVGNIISVIINIFKTRVKQNTLNSQRTALTGLWRVKKKVSTLAAFVV